MSMVLVLVALSWGVDQSSAQGPTTNYFGPEGNYAYSPTNIRKFVDTLPGLGAVIPGAIGLQRYIPVAVADTATFSGSDYYEIAVVEYSERMHSDLPAAGTRLRGYVQLETPANASVSKHIALTYPNGTAILNGGVPVLAVDNPRYLGPVIISQRNRPVRVKFTNYLPIGSVGNLFIPVDTSVMGAGVAPYHADGTSCDPTLETTCVSYTQNRATLHLHGGATPWISNEDCHQWITPAGEAGPAQIQRGVSYQNVPNMWFDPVTHNVIPGASLTPPNPYRDE